MRAHRAHSILSCFAVHEASPRSLLLTRHVFELDFASHIGTRRINDGHGLQALRAEVRGSVSLRKSPVIGSLSPLLVQVLTATHVDMTGPSLPPIVASTKKYNNDLNVLVSERMALGLPRLKPSHSRANRRDRRRQAHRSSAMTARDYVLIQFDPRRCPLRQPPRGTQLRPAKASIQTHGANGCEPS